MRNFTIKLIYDDLTQMKIMLRKYNEHLKGNKTEGLRLYLVKR